jgi:hypothetical protein
MAERVLVFIATIPAGTAKTAPTTVNFDLDGWEIESVDLEVPPGPAGTMGFYLANNGQPWIPRQAGTWLIWDDQQRSYPASGYPNASGWGITGYNVGAYDHAVTATFHVQPIATPTPDSGRGTLILVERDVPPRPVVIL